MDISLSISTLFVHDVTFIGWVAILTVHRFGSNCFHGYIFSSI